MGICPFNEWDFRKMIAANKSDKFDHFLQCFFESILRDIRNYNKKKKPGELPVTQFVSIFDVSNYAYGQMLSFGGSLIHTYA